MRGSGNAKSIQCGTLSGRLSTMLRLLSTLLALPAGFAGHCYSNAAVCQTCVADASGSACAFCGSVCQMASDACSAGAVTTEANCPGYTPPAPLPGEAFFEDASSLLATNPAQFNYGVAVTDTNGNGKLEFVVAGYGAANQAFEWDAASGSFRDVATATLQDAGSKAIGVAACDVDGDGFEELYILNTEQYSGSTSTSDRLIARDASTGEHVELFGLAQNQGALCVHCGAHRAWHSLCHGAVVRCCDAASVAWQSAPDL